MKERLSLNLDELLLEDAKKHLEDYAKMCKECKSEDYAEIICDLKFLSTEIVREVYDYLLKHKSGALLTNTAKITGYSRMGIHKQLKK